MNQRETKIDEAKVLDKSAPEGELASRREFLGFGTAAIAAAALVSGEQILDGNPLMAAERSDQKAVFFGGKDVPNVLHPPESR
jgi:hypothetical protein